MSAIGHQTRHFFVGYDCPPNPSRRCRIYLHGEHFANAYMIPADWGEHGGKLAFNRDRMALEMGCPPMEAFDDMPAMLRSLEVWYHTKTYEKHS